MDETEFLRWKDMRTEVQVVAFVIYQLKWKHVARSNRFRRLRPCSETLANLILALQDEVGERGESPGILGILMAVETRLGAMREVLR